MKTKTNSMFFKNFALYVTPVLIPLILLGSLSIYITQRYIVDQINRNNANLLHQTRDTVEIILDELDSLNINFSTNSEIIVKLKRILKNPSGIVQLEDVQSLRSIQNFIDAPANARAYIHSIYVTFENPQGWMLTTYDGLVRLEDYYDNSWYHKWVNKEDNDLIWTELREIKRYEFEKKSEKILTLYRRLSTQGAKGLLMLNINVGYIDALLASLDTFPDQLIRIVDENGQVVFANHASEYFNEQDVESLVLMGQSPSETVINGNPYVISVLISSKYGLRYITLVPKDTLYKLPYKLTTLTLILLILSLLFGTMVTFFITRKNYKYVDNIITIIRAAEQGLPLTEISYATKNEYEYIIQNMIRTFIEQRYLKIQLSEKKYKLKVLELLALQSQINPHFLFNTLETINWKIYSLANKTTLANKMVGDLSDILKYCLDDPLNTVTLEDEIKHTKSYIEIQRVRYMDKFDVVWQYDKDTLNIKVMKLILQPLIENAINHGIRDREKKGLIKIKVYRKPKKLIISIIDNGIGIPREKLESIRDNLKKEYISTGNIGLYNINQRLVIKYGQEYGVRINSKEGLGTVVYLYIPTNRLHFHTDFNHPFV